MSRTIHYFNPENDLALASGVLCYTPPTAARRMHDAGASLPLWYGSAGDKVLCHGINADWIRRVTDDFRLETTLFDHQWLEGDTPSPWGWSLSTRFDLGKMGCPEAALPSAKSLEGIRLLSHRRTAAAVARKLAGMLQFDIAPAAVEARTASEVESLANAYGQAYIKAPWSSSGRGNISTIAGRDTAYHFAADVIRRQGSVMVEPAYDKEFDFALLYECADGQCQLLGSSVFETDSHGVYIGNLLAHEDVRRQRIAQYYPLDKLDDVAMALRHILEVDIARAYTGVLGVDMLVDRDGMLDAVVEINLRKTMGYVANMFADKHLRAHRTGTFRCLPSLPLQPITHDYATVDGRLDRGRLCLNPPGAHFTFVADVSED